MITQRRCGGRKCCEYLVYLNTGMSCAVCGFARADACVCLLASCSPRDLNPGSLNPGTRRNRVPGWWDPGIRTNAGAGDTVLAKHT